MTSDLRPATAKQALDTPVKGYRGRIAPTPSGWLHLGHASTFQIAWDRARAANGRVIYRVEDLDPVRTRQAFIDGAAEDLRWWGLDWDEGPDCGGPMAPYVQSERMALFAKALEDLKARGCIYASPHSRREIAATKPVPSPLDGDPVFPSALRPDANTADKTAAGQDVNWRFRVPDGRSIKFHDGRCGEKTFVAGQDFGDFVVWKKDNWPAYELGVVVDDHAMGITEVVRGEDLLISTARQILLYEAMEWKAPEWYHCPLVIDPETGYRMSKTHKSRSLREIRQMGLLPRQPVGYYFENSRT